MQDPIVHAHKEIDLISVMVEGSMIHYGSLGHGQEIATDHVQVQRAGEEGFSHNEINPSNSSNRMIQIWALPEKKDKCASYRIYKLPAGKVTRVYGGSRDQIETLASHTIIDVALLITAEEFTLEKNFLAYLAAGKGRADNQEIDEGSLFKGEQLNFKANSDVTMIIIYED